MAKEMETQICEDCRRRLELPAFSVNKKREIRFEFKPKIYYKPICKRCEEKKRTAFNIANPWYHKIRDTVRYHAHKVKMKPKDWLKRFDLSYDWFEKLFETAWNGDWCRHCGKPFQKFGRGEMALDLTDRNYLPYRFNWRVIHRWDNTAKGTKNPQDFDVECKELWRGNNQIDLPIEIAPNTQLDLFN